MIPEHFEILSKFLLSRSGLALTPDKTYLAEVRLNPVAKRHGFKDAKELVSALTGFVSEQILNDIMEAMTTNESFFFRDEVPFENFRDVMLPHFKKTRAAARRVRIWCAACSSGQEPYSLAMILDQLSNQFEGWLFEIVATDISQEMVARAKSGEFTDFEVNRGLPANYRNSYFREKNGKWVISPRASRQNRFSRLQSARRPCVLGPFRCRLLPKCLDLFRTGDQGGRSRAHCETHAG